MSLNLSNIVRLTTACHLDHSRPLTRCKNFYILTTIVYCSMHTIYFYMGVTLLKEFLFYGVLWKCVNSEQQHVCYTLISVLHDSAVRSNDDMFNTRVRVLHQMHVFRLLHDDPGSHPTTYSNRHQCADYKQ